MIFEIRTEPWEHGQLIRIYDQEGNNFGVTQTHEDHPGETVESQARDYLTLQLDLPDGSSIRLKGVCRACGTTTLEVGAVPPSTR